MTEAGLLVCAFCRRAINGPAAWVRVYAGDHKEPAHDQCMEVHRANKLNAPNPIGGREDHAD